MIAFMVVNGFSLFDVRKLYIDEIFAYHDELVYTLEKAGKIKEGTYDKIKSSEGGKVEHTVNLLRKQLFKGLTKK
jgi:hypothetical protein